MPNDSRLKNIIELFGNTRTRVIILVTLIILILAIVISYFSLTERLGEPSQVAGAPGVSSIPGVVNPTAEFERLQKEENLQRVTRARESGGSFVPTVYRLEQGGETVAGGGVGFSTLARQELQLGLSTRSLLDAVLDANCDPAAIKRALSFGVQTAELLAAGCDVASLRAAGITAEELRALGIDAATLRAAGFTAAELRDAGFSAAELREAGFSAAELRDAGFTAAELREAGFSAAELRDAGFSAAELRDAGFSAAELRDAGFSAAELREAGFSAAELRDAGFSLDELKAAGFSAADLLAAGFTPEELLAAGFSQKDIEQALLDPERQKRLQDMLAQGATAADLKAAGFTAKELKDAGFSAADLLAAGFTPEELRKAGFSAKELKDAGLSAADLKAAGFTAKELKDAGFSAADLLAAGFSAAKLREAGFSAADLLAAGLTPEELLAAGFTIDDLLAAGFTEDQLRAMGLLPYLDEEVFQEIADASSQQGLSLDEMIAAGFSPADLRAAGFSAEQLRDAGFSAQDLINAGYSPAELYRAGVRADMMREAGFSARELCEAGYSAEQLLEGGYSEQEIIAAGCFSDEELRRLGILGNAEGMQSTEQQSRTLSDELRSRRFATPVGAGLGVGDSSTSSGTSAIIPAAALPGIDEFGSENALLRELLRRQEQQLTQQQLDQARQQMQQSFAQQANQLFNAWGTMQAMSYVEAPPPPEPAVGEGPVDTGIGPDGLPTTGALIRAGTILFGVLETSVKSDEPGPVLVTIVQEGPYKDAKILGSLSLNAESGTVTLSFNRMMLPDRPKSYNVTAYAIDPETARSGIASEVNRHYMLRYGTLLAASFLSGYGQAVAQEGTKIETTPTQNRYEIAKRTTSQQIAIGVGAMGQAVSQEVARRFLNKPPTVRVYSGTAVGVLFMQDVNN